jgi:transposase
MERKVKYDYAFKLECVELVLNQHYSKVYVSKIKEPDESNIHKWVSFYQSYGKVGLLPRRNNNYGLDFKLKVIKTIQRESLSLRDVSLKFNIPDLTIIVKWKRDFANFGLEVLKPKPKGWRGNVFCAYKNYL